MSIEKYRINQLDENQLFTSDNYQHINQDFWVFMFETTKSYSSESLLIDEIKPQLPHVRSVVYLQGRKFYALFDKKTFKNPEDLTAQLQKIRKDLKEEVTIKQVSNLKSENIISKRHLAQLLFNSLANTSAKIKNNNITGGLYWIVRVKAPETEENSDKPNIIWQYITLKIELDFYWHLNLDVKTFSNLKLTGKMNFADRKLKLNTYNQYEILVSDIRTMRRLKPTELFQHPETTYINAGVNGQKNTIEFLNIATYDTFLESKSGILYEFLKGTKKHLNKYITLKFNELDVTQKKKLDIKVVNLAESRIKNFYQNRRVVINIADQLLSDAQAIRLSEHLCKVVSANDYTPKAVFSGALSVDDINIRIVKKKEDYKNKADEHDKTGNYLLQHVTIDKNLPNEHAIKVILKELYIKNDLRQGKITLVDWIWGEWIFMNRVEIQELEPEAESETDMEAQPRPKQKKYQYKVMQVDSTGCLTFDSCMGNEPFKQIDFNEYKIIYQQEAARLQSNISLEGMVVFNHKDINLILDVNQFTIQNIESIGDALEAENEERFLQKSEILSLITDFKTIIHLTVKQKESVSKLEALIKAYKPVFSKRELLDKIGNKEEDGGANFRHAGKNHLLGKFCNFYRDKTGDILRIFFRGDEDKEIFLGSKLDIYYKIIHSEEAVYFVGEKSAALQGHFNNATHVRKVKSVFNRNGQPSTLVFEKLLETMQVQFVKHKDFTVLPFPFKYLREYKATENQLIMY